MFSLRNSTSIATAQTFFGFLFLLLAELILVVSLYYPNQYITYVSTTGKDLNYVLLRDVFLIFSIILTMLSSLTIALVWIDFAQKAKSLARNEAQTTIPRTRALLIVVETLITAGMISACVFEDPTFAILLGMLTASCAVIIYTIGMTKLIRELSQLTNPTKVSDSTSGKTRTFRRVIFEITIVCLAAYICLFGAIGNCMVVLAYFSIDWRVYSVPGSISSVVISLQLTLTFLVLFEWVVLISLILQIGRIIKKRRKGGKPKVIVPIFHRMCTSLKERLNGLAHILLDADKHDLEVISNPENVEKMKQVAAYDADS